MYHPDFPSKSSNKQRGISSAHKNQINESAQLRELHRYRGGGQEMPPSERRIHPALIVGLAKLILGLGR